MAKGASIKFKSYEETIPKILDLLKLENGLANADTVVIKPFLLNPTEKYVSVDLVEQVLRFCLMHKKSLAKIFIAEGADGYDTMDLFDELGYRKLSERYSIGLIDLNNTETESIEKAQFEKFKSIDYPSILKNSFVISLAKLDEDEELGITGSLPSMLGAFPGSSYKGLLSRKKSKIRKWPIKYSINDIIQCKMPDFAIIDASSKGLILAGLPLDIDKQAAKILDKDWKSIPYISLIEENSILREVEKPLESEI
ncbi:MAG: DUF362 domain-containing protein [Nanoarchaeota archaeon]|nr:DUF362 domain-containing protein [Nanoarchaeota archaeon]